MPLALSGFWATIIVVCGIGLLALTGYAIWQMRSDEGWEERPPPPRDG
jgi:hypothetical protein